MQAFGRAIRRFFLVVCVLALIFITLKNWSFVFSKRVDGQVVSVERVTSVNTSVNSTLTESALYSFAIAIREKNKEGFEIFTASSEDRQWAVVKAGQCVEARYFPYPPWDLDRSGTYFNARLLKLKDCAPAFEAISPTPTAIPTATPASSL